jgi:hypothetical protein
VGDDWKFITTMSISNFNDRFKHLNESEKNTFKILISDFDTKNNYLEALKKENVEYINRKLKEEKDPQSIELLNMFKLKLENIKGATNSNLDESIISCLELKEKLR